MGVVTGVLLLALRIIGVPVVIAGTAWMCREIGGPGPLDETKPPRPEQHPGEAATRQQQNRTAE